MVGFLDFKNNLLYIWAVYRTLSPSWPIGELIWLTLFIKIIYLSQKYID